VLNDPVNLVDPEGLDLFPGLDPDTPEEEIIEEENNSEKHIRDFEQWTEDNYNKWPEQPDEDEWCENYDE